jgi:hypothetical protein
VAFLGNIGKAEQLTKSTKEETPKGGRVDLGLVLHLVKNLNCGI